MSPPQGHHLAGKLARRTVRRLHEYKTPFLISPEQNSEISKLAKSIGASRSAVVRVFLSHLTKPAAYTKPVHLSGREANGIATETIRLRSYPCSVGLISFNCLSFCQQRIND